jgi:tryptophan-rich sensory protein
MNWPQFAMLITQIAAALFAMPPTAEQAQRPSWRAFRWVLAGAWAAFALATIGTAVLA